MPEQEEGFRERLRTAGRNDSCPCGSGKKYKKCHLAQDQQAEHEALAKAGDAARAQAAAAIAAGEEPAPPPVAKHGRPEPHIRPGGVRGGRQTSTPRKAH